MEIWNAAVANRPYDFAAKRNETVAAMHARLSESGPVFRRHVRHATTNGELDDTFVDATSGSPRFFTYGGLIAHVLTDAACCRTIASGALHAAGITDLEDDPLSWTALRPPKEAATLLE
jgi:hypothetical protein